MITHHIISVLAALWALAIPGHTARHATEEPGDAPGSPDEPEDEG